ncbi:MAG: Gfo/Idh/MocA family oxidoreductase [Chloroflexi bacterium]|nr:Gfo/Idh/MocA family oxidoreductase [Chloroflexota bacterium]
MSLSLCVVGCGNFARIFSREMLAIAEEVDLFFASRDAQRAAEYAAAFKGKASFGSYEAAAADPRVEAMYLCTPHYLHREHVAMAAAAGKHILVEKPLARTMEEARAINQTAERAGVTLMVAENYRFMAAVRLAKELIDSGALGDLRMIQLQEEADFRPDQWRTSRELNGGGVLIDGGIHKIDILLYLAGRPRDVYATALPQVLAESEGEDGVVVITHSKTGAVGLINHSWAKVRGLGLQWVSVSGAKARISFDLTGTQLTIDDGILERTLEAPGNRHGIIPMVQEFRDSIRQGREPETSGLVGMEDLEITLKAYESMESGQTVLLDP